MQDTSELDKAMYKVVLAERDYERLRALRAEQALELLEKQLRIVRTDYSELNRYMVSAARIARLRQHVSLEKLLEDVVRDFGLEVDAQPGEKLSSYRTLAAAVIRATLHWEAAPHASLAGLAAVATEMGWLSEDGEVTEEGKKFLS